MEDSSTGKLILLDQNYDNEVEGKSFFLYNCWVFIPCRKEEIHSLEVGKSVFLP